VPHSGGRQRGARHTTKKQSLLPVWFSGQAALKDPQAFTTNGAPTRTPPGADKNLALLLFAAAPGEKTLCMHVCVCVYVHVCLCMSCQPPLNSPTVKCATFNLNFLSGFHNVHYQQWAFSTQVPFRKLSSEKGNNIKKIEKHNASDRWEALRLPQKASACVP